MNKLILALAAVALPASANAAPFINGNFETGPTPGTFTTLAAGSNVITGWTVGGGGIDYVGTYWNAQSGSRSIDLSGMAPGSISQSFDTIAGMSYAVTFFLGGNGDGGLVPKTATVSATGGAATNYTVLASPTPTMNYTAFTYNFMAIGAMTTLTFASATGNPFGPVLDNVAVTAVPEPMTWTLMTLGFGMLGFAMRRQRKAIGTRIRFA